MAKKSKSGMSINDLSTREYALIFILVIAVVSYLLYTFLLEPQYMKYKDLVNVNESLEVENKALEIEYKKIDQYNKDLENLNSELLELERIMPTYIEQDDIILKVDKFSEVANVNVTSLNFGSKNTSASGKIVEANITDLGVNLTVKGEYFDILKFLSLIENNTRILVINNTQFTSSKDGLVNGSINITFTSYISPYSQTGYNPEPIKNNGKDNIFELYDGYQGNTAIGKKSKPQVFLQPDINVFINSSLDVSQKIIMGHSTNFKSELYSGENKIVNGKVIVADGSDGNIKYMLTLGTSIYEAENAFVRDDGKVLLHIYSESRKAEDDNVALNLDITNNSSIPVVVDVINDDSEKPRYISGNIVGDVRVEK